MNTSKMFNALLFAWCAAPMVYAQTPTANPSLAPSAAPSDAPSLKPSAAPSESPSLAPSDAPSLKPSADPSGSPSLAPSAAPSLKPSASPSDAPSLKPSSSPSDAPSLAPSASPSLKPSGQPSDVPSLKPSASPSDAPSLAPSTSPSMVPSVSGMPSSLPSAPPTKPMPQIEVDFDGFCMNLVNATGLPSASGYPAFYTAFGDAVEGAIISLMTPLLTTPGQRILKVSVTDVAGNAITENRRLAASEYDILTEVKYDVLFEQFCERGNCDDATTMTATVSDLLTTTIDAAIEDGSLYTSVTANMVTAGIDGTASFVELATGECTPATVVNSILPMMWYPDWNGANTGCIMDGNEDDYMRLNPEGYYLFETLEACCTRHYPWDYNTCAGVASTAVGPDGAALYYPDWEGENKSCKNDGAQPTYMSSNTDAWMFADLESCCKARYTWNLNECMGTGATVAAGTNKWFADYENSKCIQDCVGSAPCGGLAETWDTTYDTAEDCCSNKLNWVSQGTCVASSTGAAVTASNKWYVDWTTETCKQECDGAAPCAGMAESWEETFASMALCCQRMPWAASCGPFAG